MRPTVAGLREDYRSGRRRPTGVITELLERIEAEPEPVWISLVDPALLLEQASRLEREGPASRPLYGIPFAVKDNIDVRGLPTTAAFPKLDRLAEESATVVRRLVAAGALLVGKTNMDQFATGLVGTRSPYGALSAAGFPDRVSGGSSSGSAVALARGLVAFSLGTDTAGSGRVPAAFNGLVGCKPTQGLVSTSGVMPACASLDCVSIFTHTVTDAATVLDVIAGFDERDPWSRARQAAPGSTDRGVIGVPLPAQVELDEPEAEDAWAEALERAGEHWQIEAVDISALLAAAPLLYDVWVAERTADVGALIEGEPDGLDPTVAEIIAAGTRRSAVDVFRATHELARMRRAALPIWDAVDALLVPTAPSHPTHAEVASAPVAVNARLGRYTNFVNLMDLAGLALPAAVRVDGLHFGVSLLAPAWSDQRLLELGAEWLGEPGPSLRQPGAIVLAVAGAHMRGLPLSHQLTERGAHPLQRELTAACYRLYELPGEGLRRPGLVRVDDGGAQIEVELWELSPQALGELVAEVPAPLAIGTVELADGSEVTGFVCEGYAAGEGTDITSHGGWRAYLDTLTSL